MMRTKMVSAIVLLLIVTIPLTVCSVMAKPQKAEEKNDNPNVYIRVADSGTWLIIENGAGPKRGWCIFGESAGQSVVYLDTAKLGPKAVEKMLASGQWIPSHIFDGYIYKIVQYVDLSIP